MLSLAVKKYFLCHLFISIALILSCEASWAEYLKIAPVEKYAPVSPMNGKYPKFNTADEANAAWKKYYDGLIDQSNFGLGSPIYKYIWLDFYNSESSENCNGTPSVTNGTPHWYCQDGDLYQKASPQEWYLARKDRGITIVKLQECPKYFNKNSEIVSGNLEEANLVVNNFCEKNTNGPPLTIEIRGVSVTNALPSINGPIPQNVFISLNGVPKSGEALTVHFEDESYMKIGAISGVTNEHGLFNFDFIPPYFANFSIYVKATCYNCENTASKTITVLPTDLNRSEDLQMCYR